MLPLRNCVTATR